MKSNIQNPISQIGTQQKEALLKHDVNENLNSMTLDENFNFMSLDKDEKPGTLSLKRFC